MSLAVCTALKQQTTGWVFMPSVPPLKRQEMLQMPWPILMETQWDSYHWDLFLAPNAAPLVQEFQNSKAQGSTSCIEVKQTKVIQSKLRRMTCTGRKHNSAYIFPWSCVSSHLRNNTCTSKSGEHHFTKWKLGSYPCRYV